MREAPWIVALGANHLNAGLQDVARTAGARLMVVDWNQAPPFVGAHHLRLDIKDSEQVLDEVRASVNELRFAYTSSDVATETVARIHAAYGLRRPTPEALATARHKPAMNAAWRGHDLGPKRFKACGSLDELIEFHRATPGASIVKPAAAASSRGVSVIGAAEGTRPLSAAWVRARDRDPTGEVFVEEYIHGTEFSVEMLGDGAGNVQVLAVGRKYHSPNAGRNRVAVKIHYNPPDVSRARQARIAAFARRCFRALGLRSSLGHLELIERDDGELVPIELGARSSGYIATHLVDAVTALEDRPMLGIYERVLRGEQLADAIVRSSRSSMLFYYDFPPGVGKQSGTSLTHFLPPGIRSVAADRSELVGGRKFRQLEDDAQRPGFEILVGDRRALTIAAVNRAEAAHRREFLERRAQAPEPRNAIAAA